MFSFLCCYSPTSSFDDSEEDTEASTAVSPPHAKPVPGKRPPLHTTQNYLHTPLDANGFYTAIRVPVPPLYSTLRRMNNSPAKMHASFALCLSPSSNYWLEPHAGKTKVRSTDYFHGQGKKAPSKPSMFPTIAVDLIRNTGASIKNGNLIIYTVRDSQDQSSNSLLQSFLNGSDAFRSSRLKLIQKVAQGPFLLRKLIGDAPSLLGKQVPILYYGGITENYLDIVIDIASGGRFANSIAASCLGHCSALAINLSFVLEARTETELPERLLSSTALHNLNFEAAPTQDQFISHLNA